MHDPRKLVDSGFRAAHHQKGGAMFGFDKVAAFTGRRAADIGVGMHRDSEYLRVISKWREEFVIAPKMERILN
jgi:hypothetical protein